MSGIHYPAVNNITHLYTQWDAVWPLNLFVDPSNGFRDFSIDSEFPALKPLYSDYETSWIDGPRWTRLNRRFWWLSIVASVVYLIAVFGGQRMMKNKKAFDLKFPLAIWNLGLAVFSFIGASRMLPHLLYGLYLNHHSFFLCRSACESFGIGASGFWANLFIWSKLVELLDTAFLVLRKKPVSFLHWFHHATVLMYCWHAGQYQMPTGIFFVTMNYIVHTIMYFYYFLAAVTKPPKWGKIVTILQIAQMLIGMFITGYHYYLLKTIPNCDGSHNNLIAAFIMYTAYMVLFVQFFVSRYIGKNVASRSTKASSDRKKKE